MTSLVTHSSCYGLGLGHGSRVMWVTGQLTGGSRVTKCDALSALLLIVMMMMMILLMLMTQLSIH